MAKYTQTADEFYEGLKKSWTWRRLTEDEKKEQQILRRDFIDSFKRNLRGNLDNISIQEKDGSITNLGEKHGIKEGH